MDTQIETLPNTYTRHIRNAYRVLMSRGKRGCFIYCCNQSVEAFLRKCLDANN